MSLARRALIQTHRWLGIAGSFFFIAWFISGIAMMYTRMPRLTPEERLRRAPALAVDRVSRGPAEIALTLARPPQRVRIGMAYGRPVYRFNDGLHWTTMFADTGEPLPPLDEAAALAIARSFFGEHAALHHTGIVRDPDQWSLQIRGLLPAHRVALGDDAHSSLYISAQTAEPVLITSRSTRLWGYLGAVVHWIYFTPVRRDGAAWTQLIIWSSIAGCVLCASGLVWGLWQFVRLRGTPYTGLMRWHHYAGLVFGLITLTFVFSGLLSMNPWNWSPGTAAARPQRDALTGGALNLAALTPARLRDIVAAFEREFTVKEIELLQFRGELLAEAYRAPAAMERSRRPLGDPGDVIASRLPLDHRLLWVGHPERGVFARFDDAAMLDAARAAMPDVPVANQEWLSDYDAYYYDRHRGLPLPVLRVRYDDPAATWLYFDPFRGAIIRKEERLTRLNRWLYHGLHSFDFPWLYRQRPLWDIVVVGLSLGGLFVSVSSAPAGWRRFHRTVVTRQSRSRTSTESTEP